MLLRPRQDGHPTDREAGPDGPAPVIDLDALERLGVSDALRPRTLASLRHLDFITMDGEHTPEFDALKRVPSADVPARLGEMLKNTYSLVFQTIGDPATATPQEIEDAFKAFEPRGQLIRMVQLFVSLMQYTGLMPEKSLRKPGPKRLSKANGTTEGATRKVLVRRPKPSQEGVAVVEQPPKPDAGTAHVARVDLGIAGTVSLTVSVNPLALSKDDRTAFYAIVDAFHDWAAAHTVAARRRRLHPVFRPARACHPGRGGASGS